MPSGGLFFFGSLTVPLAKMEKEFEAKHPGVDVKREAGGSTKMARMISEQGKPADIMASADYMVIDKSLIPRKSGDITNFLDVATALQWNYAMVHGMRPFAYWVLRTPDFG